MGYSLRIGEAKMEWNDERVSIDCDIVRQDDAPAFGDPTDYENQRWPSYTAWANAMRALGLVDLMYDRRNGGSGELQYGGKWLYPLIQEHPGASPITELHAEYAEEKLRHYKALHPTHVAQYAPPKPDAKPFFGDRYRDEDLVDDPKYDGNLCRGEWLVYWLRWAVDNCKQPVFVNS